MAMIKTNLKQPENKGKLDIYSDIVEDNAPIVTIIGDPDGLRYLSEVLQALADYDQDSHRNLPKGEKVKGSMFTFMRSASWESIHARSQSAELTPRGQENCLNL